MVEKLREYLDSKTQEELEADWKEMFGDELEIPKGWVSIEDHLPMMLAIDIGEGATRYKVKYKNGNEGESYVSDHGIWYHFAKKAGITHWFND